MTDKVEQTPSDQENLERVSITEVLKQLKERGLSLLSKGFFIKGWMEWVQYGVQKALSDRTLRERIKEVQSGLIDNGEVVLPQAYMGGNIGARVFAAMKASGAIPEGMGNPGHNVAHIVDNGGLTMNMSRLVRDCKKLSRLCKEGATMVVGPSAGIGAAVVESVKENRGDVIPVGTRSTDQKVLAELASTNPENVVYPGDLFSGESTTATQALLSEEMANATGHHVYNAAINVDKIPSANDTDPINPLTKKPRGEDYNTEDKRRESREAAADIQYNLFRDYLKNIYDNRLGNNDDVLNITFLGSIANMFGVAGSEYGKLKEKCTKLAEEYQILFDKKFGCGNVNMTELICGLVNTDMGNERMGSDPEIGNRMSGIIQIKGPGIPVAGEFVNQKKPFSPQQIGELITSHVNMKRGKLPARILVHSEQSLDLGALAERNTKDNTIIDEAFSRINFTYDNDGNVILTEDIGKVLLGLREEKLSEYHRYFYSGYPDKFSEEELSGLAKKGISRDKINSEFLEGLGYMSLSDWKKEYSEILSPIHRRPKLKMLLSKNRGKGQIIFKELETNHGAIPRETLLGYIAQRFLNNHI